MENKKNKSFHVFLKRIGYSFLLIIWNTLLKTWKMKKKIHNSSPKKSTFEKRSQKRGAF